MIDTHSHLYLEEFDSDRDDAVARALSAGVKFMVLPNVGLQTIDSMVGMDLRYPDCTAMALGLHPTSVDAGFRRNLEAVYECFSRHKFVAVGEVGIDLYWDTTYREQQLEAFDIQLHWAEQFGLPVIIHCREGLDEVLSVFANYSGRLPQCVFHSFGGTVDDVERIRRYGDFYFGINGIVTFKNSKLDAVLPEIGIDRIVLETDCPYLAPVPYRGKRNESSYIPLIADKIAGTLGLSVEMVSSITDRNAKSLFPLAFES